MVAVGNLLYCAATFAAVVWFCGDLTMLGKFYFAIEILVIALIAIFEFAYAFKKKRA